MVPAGEEQCMANQSGGFAGKAAFVTEKPR